MAVSQNKFLWVPNPFALSHHICVIFLLKKKKKKKAPHPHTMATKTNGQATKHISEIGSTIFLSIWEYKQYMK